MKLSKLAVALFAVLSFAAVDANAQFGGMINRAKDKVKETKPKTVPAKTATKNAGNNQAQTDAAQKGGGDESDARAGNAKKLAKAAGMPKAANTDAALNKLLFRAADETALIPRRVVVVDKDWFTTIGARNERARRIFAVLARTTEAGKCGKQMVQFDQSWKEDKNAWGLIYVQNVGEITPIACGAIGK